MQATYMNVPLENFNCFGAYNEKHVDRMAEIDRPDGMLYNGYSAHVVGASQECKRKSASELYEDLVYSNIVNFEPNSCQ